MVRIIVSVISAILIVGCVSNEFLKLEEQSIAKVSTADIDFAEAKPIVRENLTKASIEESRPYVALSEILYGKFNLYEIVSDSGEVIKIEMEGYVRTGLTSIVTSLIVQPHIMVLDAGHNEIPSETSVSFIPMDSKGPKRIRNSTTFESPASAKYYVVCTALNESLMDISKGLKYGVVNTGVTLEKYGPAVTGKYSIKVQ